ncbi:MAG: TIGR02391 family protein [Devosiaceae bacterium]|nr:TIGR02391 family protein [Devosiaceae bacterium]
MTRRAIEGNYARLKGLRDAVASEKEDYLSRDFVDDYSLILKNLRKECEDDFLDFDLSDTVWYENEYADILYTQAIKSPLRSKILQLISYLENVHNASNRIVEIGSVYNLIKDELLKSRCSDLLSAPDHFDRVINQATLVLEERLRTILPDLKEYTGQTLVSKAMNKIPNDSRIKFSDKNSEQESYVALFRGVVGVFRNESHHRFMNEITREQALQICAFIDTLLTALDKADIVSE